MADRYGKQPLDPIERDGIYPSEVARDRPIGETRTDCGGDDPHDKSNSASNRFNKSLRDQPFRGERG